MGTIFFTKLTAKMRGFDNLRAGREEGETSSGTHTQYNLRGLLAAAVRMECTHTFGPTCSITRNLTYTYVCTGM